LIHFYKRSMLVSLLAARGLSTSSRFYGAQVINEVVVIGAGSMGAGIAQVAAQTGHKVTLVDINSQVLSEANRRITESLALVAKKDFKDDLDGMETFKAKTMQNLSLTTNPKKSLETADIVVEAVAENLKFKHKILKEYDAMSPEKTIFATNTSSLPITEIASATSRPDRFGGLHFFNPVPYMKLLEVVRGDKTSDETQTALLGWGKALGKVTLECKDTPGFIVNRLLVPLVLEAIRMVERGDCSIKDVDNAMRLGAGHVIGPIALADMVGLDVLKMILDGWSERYPREQLFRRNELLERLVSEGRLGRKTGEGFLKHI